MLLNVLQVVAEFSLLGCVEVASVALVVYYVYAKTRAPAIIAGLFPNLNMNINSSLLKFNTMGNELFITLRSGTNSETKPPSLLAHGKGSQDMLKITPHAGHKPYINSLFDWGVYFPFVAQTTRIKKYKFPQVSEYVQKDPMLTRAIRQAAEQILRDQQTSNDDMAEETDEESSAYKYILEQQERRSMNILKDMRSTLNHFLLALTSWVLYKLLPCFLSGVVTHTQQIEMLKAAAQRAPGIPLIFLPLHRSHLDYIMVTFIVANNDIRSPLVAAGNNLQIPVFGALLRGLGAFFIKRKMDPVEGKKDILYRAVLQIYLQHALKLGHNVEFFIEGGRTRTGKPCMPKGGILSVIVNAFMDGSIPDALLVPVSVNYERLVDGNFVREQKGEKKVPETFRKAISAIWKALNSKYGVMRIDFNQPYSIRELVESYNKISKPGIKPPSARILKHNQSTSSLYGTDVVCEEHRTLIECISRQVVYDCAAATSVMSTNALAFLLLTQFRNGANIHEIAKALDELRNSLNGRKDIGFSGESLHIIYYASDLLGKELVTRTQDERGQCYLKPKQSKESFIELAYYSNMLTPHFALESILMTTFHALLPPRRPQDHANKVGVVRRKLIETSLENCDVFRYEYILNKPTQVLENLLEVTLDELLIKGCIKRAEETEETENEIESRKIARQIEYAFDDDDDYEYEVEKVEEPDLFLAIDTLPQQRSLCEVLAPFGQTYFVVAQCLTILYKNPMLESEFIKFIVSDLTTKVSSSSCVYAESISTDSVRNCLKLFEKWTVIEICNQHGLRLLSLGTMYEESKESVKTVVQRISAIVPNYRNGYF